MVKAFSPDLDPLGRWSPGDKANREKRMLSLFGNRISWQQQASLDIFKEVGYAEGEQKAIWSLPGHGSAYVDCGELLYLGCDHVDKHESGMVNARARRRNCMRKACPTCFEGWAAAEGERSLVRFASFVVGSDRVRDICWRLQVEMSREPRAIFHKALGQELERLIQQFRKKVVHFVLSPPDGVVTESCASFAVGRKLAYQIAKESGIQGGAGIFHPYRLKCPACLVAIPDYMKACPKCGGSAFKWFWSPHFHIVGFGWLENISEGYARHGWIVKGLGVRKSVFWTFQYLLSHAGVSKFHTTTWFGNMGYHALRALKLPRLRELCPECGAEFRPLIWIGKEEPPPFEYNEEDPFANDFLGSSSDWRNLG